VLKKYYFGVLFVLVGFILIPSTHAATATTIKLSTSSACIVLGGIWDFQTSTCNVAKLKVNQGEVRQINSGVTLNIHTLENHGKINIQTGGKLFAIDARHITNYAGAEINNMGILYSNSIGMDNYGKINNKGTIDIKGGYTSNRLGGEINNDLNATLKIGVIINTNGAKINNKGLMVGDKIFNFGDLSNNGKDSLRINTGLYNSGKINNGGTIDGSGSLFNNNKATLNNDVKGKISLKEYIVLNNGSVFNNNGHVDSTYKDHIINNCGAIFSNHGIISTSNSQCVGK
jgi:hypothetical protein